MRLFTTCNVKINAPVELISKFRESLQGDIKQFNKNVETQFGNDLLLIVEKYLKNKAFSCFIDSLFNHNLYNLWFPKVNYAFFLDFNRFYTAFKKQLYNKSLHFTKIKLFETRASNNRNQVSYHYFFTELFYSEEEFREKFYEYVKSKTTPNTTLIAYSITQFLIDKSIFFKILHEYDNKDNFKPSEELDRNGNVFLKSLEFCKEVAFEKYFDKNCL